MTISTALISIATPHLQPMQEFYQQLLDRRWAVEIPGTYVEFRLPGLRLGLYRSSNPEFAACLGATSLCLQVESLDELLARPVLSSIPISSVREAFHGREVDLCDPDGNRIVIHQPSESFWQKLDLSDRGI